MYSSSDVHHNDNFKVAGAVIFLKMLKMQIASEVVKP